MLFLLKLLVSVVAAFYLLQTYRSYVRLRQFKGPSISGFSRLWLLKANSSGRMHQYYSEVNNKYGSTARVGPNHLITRDPAVIKRMNAVRSSYTRSIWYNSLRLHPTLDHIASVRDEDIHTRLRVQMAPGYSGKENLHLEKDIDERLLQLFDLIKSRYLSTPERFVRLDLARITTYFTLDVISTVAFGKPFGFLTTDSDPFGYIAQLEKVLPVMMGLGAYPEAQRILRLPIVQKLAPNAGDLEGLGKVMGWAADTVAERFGEDKIVRNDMLGSFLAHGLSQEQLESETLVQITAGSDSSATAIRMTLFHICTNPYVYVRLMEELDSALAANQLSRPIMKDHEARQLPFLQACIKEGLRFYPPVTGQLAKQVPPDGDTIDGKFVPPGTQVGWNIWGAMHSRETFGDDADIFRPARWLLPVNAEPQEQERLAKMTETQGLVFGYGRYGCLGRPVAMMELDKVIAEWLIRFQLQIADPANPFVGMCVGFFLAEKMYVVITERNREDVKTDPYFEEGNDSGIGSR